MGFQKALGNQAENPVVARRETWLCPLCRAEQKYFDPTALTEVGKRKFAEAKGYLEELERLTKRRMPEDAEAFGEHKSLRSRTKKTTNQLKAERADKLRMFKNCHDDLLEMKNKQCKRTHEIALYNYLIRVGDEE